MNPPPAHARRSRVGGLILGAAALAATSANAATRLVPEQYATVQAAVNACAPGDSVSLAPGEYAERVTMREGVILGARPAGSEVVVRGLAFNGLSSATRVDHVTVRGGVSRSGGAASLVNSSPTLLDCTFEGNRAPDYYDFAHRTWLPGRGGAVSITGAGSVPNIERCTFRANVAVGLGGGIYATDASPTIVECVFEQNEAQASWQAWVSGKGGALYLDRSAAILRDCIVRQNVALDVNSGTPGLGGGIAAYDSPVLVEGCEVSWNRTSPGGHGGGITGSGTLAVPLTIRRCTIAYNSTLGTGGNAALGQYARVESCIIAFALEGVGIAGSYYEISCSDVFGNAGGDALGGTDAGGNFSFDPGFCNAAEQQLKLRVNSPCIPGRHPTGADCGQIGAWSTACGGTPTEETSWGGLRARFRATVKQ